MDRKIRPAKIMDQALFEQLISELLSWEQRPRNIYLNMSGEPLQDPQFEKRLGTVKDAKLGGVVDLQSNFQLLTPALIDAILSTGIRRITVGFDGATQEVYEAHRVRCDYEKVLANIQAFAQARNEGGYKTGIAIQFVRTKANVHEVSLAYEMFKGFLDPRMDCFQDNLAKDWGDREGRSDYFYMEKVRGNRPTGCAIFRDQLIVDSDGTLAACCWDYNLAVSDGGLGDVGETGMLAAWRGHKRAKLATILDGDDLSAMPEKCRSCPLMFLGDDANMDLSILPDRTTSRSPYGFTYGFAVERPG